MGDGCIRRGEGRDKERWDGEGSEKEGRNGRAERREVSV